MLLVLMWSLFPKPGDGSSLPSFEATRDGTIGTAEFEEVKCTFNPPVKIEKGKRYIVLFDKCKIVEVERKVTP